MLIYESHDIKKSTKLSNQFVKNLRVPLASHAEYRQFVQGALAKRVQYERIEKWLDTNHEGLLSVFLLDFDGIHDKLRRLYSQRAVGQIPYDPQILLRSLCLRLVFKETSITVWAKRVQSEALLAIFCGTDPKEAPAVGTYYDFFKRLENGRFQAKCCHRALPSELRKAARKSLRQAEPKPDVKEQKTQEAPIGVVKQLVEQTIAREQEPITNDLEKILNEILLEVAVKPSVMRGKINDLRQIVLAADGSTMPTQASWDGKATCDCRQKGIYRCEHLRKFSDPDARWGWDNRLKDFVFGYRYWQLVYGESGHNLPIYLSIASANAHEAVMAVTAIDRFYKQILPIGGTIGQIAFDALYDIYAFYDYLVHKGIDYAIPYAQEPAKCISLGKDKPQLFNKNGVPYCDGGLLMRLHLADKQGRKTYACPVKRLARRDGKKVYVTHRHQCPLAALCEPNSKLGPFVHVHKDIDRRIHPAIPRDSKRYKELFNMRSCCERSNSMKKYTYLMGFPSTRVINYAFIHLACTSILEHSKVWVQEKLKNTDLKTAGILSLFQ